MSHLQQVWEMVRMLGARTYLRNTQAKLVLFFALSLARTDQRAVVVPELSAVLKAGLVRLEQASAVLLRIDERLLHGREVISCHKRQRKVEFVFSATFNEKLSS